MISFSTGELRRKNTVLELRNILGQNWENKLVKTSDELVTLFARQSDQNAYLYNDVKKRFFFTYVCTFTY